jgi:NAD kinase
VGGIEKIVVVTKKTALEELVERFNTLSQARFYIEHSGVSFGEYQAAHGAYAESLAALKRALPRSVKHQSIDRGFLPTFTFGPRDLVVTLGQDGLVINTAKYLTDQPIVALNPDPARIDGILNPLLVPEAAAALDAVLSRRSRVARVSMAQVDTNDGRSLFAVNDLFIGYKSHGSARYRIRHGGYNEDQSSSGIIVSTGAGSTGWFKSVVTGSLGIAAALSGKAVPGPRDMGRFDWEAEQLKFCVREPFVSRVTHATCVSGSLGPAEELSLTSWMPERGVIFSDGVEEDFLDFNAGTIATVTLSRRKAHLVQRSW